MVQSVPPRCGGTIGGTVPFTGIWRPLQCRPPFPASGNLLPLSTWWRGDGPKPHHTWHYPCGFGPSGGRGVRSVPIHPPKPIQARVPQVEPQPHRPLPPAIIAPPVAPPHRVPQRVAGERRAVGSAKPRQVPPLLILHRHRQRPTGGHRRVHLQPAPARLHQPRRQRAAGRPGVARDKPRPAALSPTQSPESAAARL